MNAVPKLPPMVFSGAYSRFGGRHVLDRVVVERGQDATPDRIGELEPIEDPPDVLLDEGVPLLVVLSLRGGAQPEPEPHVM